MRKLLLLGLLILLVGISSSFGKRFKKNKGLYRGNGNSVGSRPFSHKQFQQWKRQFKKRYGSSYEYGRHMVNFRRNWEMVERHNLGRRRRGFKMALNKFADMDNGEFRKTRLGLVYSQEELPALYFTDRSIDNTTWSIVSEAQDSSVDWREKGVVTPVEDQGACASCWCFSAAAAIEARYRIKHGKTVVLSKQNILDCSRNDGNDGCNGGWMHYAFEHIRKTGGVNLGEKYPYKGKQGACKFNAKAAHAPLKWKVYEVVQANNESAMMEALKSGPVSIGFDSGLFSFQSYSSGIYSDPNCSDNINHAMLMVGYGTDKESGEPYWLIKNSFGADWGEDGYVRVARSGNVCGVLSYAVYPIVK